MNQGEVCIIPVTKMRERFRKIQKTSIATQLKMALEAVAEDIASDFAASVSASEEYDNCEEGFHQGKRKPLILKQPIKRTEHFAAELKAQSCFKIEDHPSLNFKYVEREIVPTRTTGPAEYSDGTSKKRFIRVDLLLAGDFAILGELKLRGDHESAFYALIQLLASACELATNNQRRRLSRYYHELLPLPITRFDLYLFFHEFDKRKKPNRQILERTGELAEELTTTSKNFRNMYAE